MILKTDRLLLRPMTMADAPALFAILGDPQTMAFWDRAALPRLATVEAQLADELTAMAAGGFLYWMVVKDRDPIGSIDLSNMDGFGASTGFAFRRDRWGQGLAREALTAVVEQAFSRLAMNQLTARVQTANGRAIRLLESVGFHKSGELPAILREGEPRPCVLYSLSR